MKRIPSVLNMMLVAAMTTGLTACALAPKSAERVELERTDSERVLAYTIKANNCWTRGAAPGMPTAVVVFQEDSDKYPDVLKSPQAVRNAFDQVFDQTGNTEYYSSVVAFCIPKGDV